jgi:hypothetical protein
VSSMIVIVASALCGIGFSATLAIALGRAAARGDAELARELDRRPSPRLRDQRQSYAGLGSARARIGYDQSDLY